MTETQDIQLGPLTFTVDTAGPKDGTPVLLLHGFPETRFMWRAQMEALGREGFRGVAPDQRGYSVGARPAGTESYATEHLVADAVGIMDALGAPRFHLVGHDWGGQLAWLIAAGHAERVLSLSVLSRPHPGAFARAMVEDPAQAKRSGHHRAFREVGAVERMRESGMAPMREALIAQGVPAPAADVYFETLAQPGGIESAMAWYRASGLAAADLPATTVRTLYVWGDTDSSVGRRAAELTADHVAGPYRFVTLPGAGHFLADEASDQVSALIIGHLRQEPPAG
jgi:pimeloyl-ACP methyl ester carboxylesterase